MLSNFTPACEQGFLILHETLNFEAPIYTESDITQSEELISFEVDLAAPATELATWSPATEEDSDKSDDPADGEDSENKSKVGEISDGENWDVELTLYVSANAQEIVTLGGTEITLSEAMHLIPITKENVNAVLAQVKQLVAEAQAKKNAITEEEESAQAEEKVEKQESAKDKEGDKNQAKAQKEQENPKAAETDKRSQQKVQPIITSELSADRLERTTVSTTSQANSQEVQTDDFAKGMAEPVAATPAIAAAGAGTSNRLESTVSTDGSEFIGESGINDIPEVMTIEPMIDKTAKIAEPEALEPGAAGLFAAEILDDDLNLKLEIKEIDENGLQVDVNEHEPMADTFDGFVESAEITISHIEAGLEPDDTLALAHLAEEFITDDFELAEPPIYSPAQADILELNQVTHDEQVSRIDPAFEEVEDSLIQLAERIETAEPDVAETVNEILGKIVEVPARLELVDSENVITEVQAQSELVELFTELFDQMGLEYTTETIKLLATLTIKWNLAEEIKKLMIEEPAQESPQDIGTHEIIKKFLVAINKIRKALTQAYAIGKSALRLYEFSLAA